MAEKYRKLPSEILHITDGYVAWCVDEAVLQYDLLKRKGHAIKPKDTVDNNELLKEFGL